MRVADTKHGKTCASESPALLVGRGFAYHARTLTTHRSNVCCVFLCVLPEDCWAKEKLLAVWENQISICILFSFLPDVHAQFTRYTRKPREFLVLFEETHFGGHSFISLTYLLTWPFVIHSQSQSRICWWKIYLTVTPEWVVHSRPRYQDSVQVNRILFAQL